VLRVEPVYSDPLVPPDLRAELQEVLTIHFAPDKVFVAASVDFEDAVAVGAIETLIADTEADLRASWPEIANVYIKPKAQGQAAGTIT